MKNKFAYLFAVLALSLILAGCVESTGGGSSPQDKAQGRQFGGRPPFGGNLTPQQRDEFINARIEAATKACDGKAVGDNCSLESPRGEINGTCFEMNGTVGCRAGFGRKGNFTRENWQGNYGANSS